MPISTGRLLALPANIRLAENNLKGANTLAYLSRTDSDDEKFYKADTGKAMR
jgi:hypothetical protein